MENERLVHGVNDRVPAARYVKHLLDSAGISVYLSYLGSATTLGVN